MSKANRPTLKYLRNDDVRKDIVAAAGIRTDRYGGNNRRRLSKEHLLTVARTLDSDRCVDEVEVALEELSLSELYVVVCRCVGGEYQGTAGNQWGIKRENLKRIHRAITHHE